MSNETIQELFDSIRESYGDNELDGWEIDLLHRRVYEELEQLKCKNAELTAECNNAKNYMVELSSTVTKLSNERSEYGMRVAEAVRDACIDVNMMFEGSNIIEIRQAIRNINLAPIVNGVK